MTNSGTLDKTLVSTIFRAIKCLEDSVEVGVE